MINLLNNFLLKKFRIDFTFLNVVNKNNMIKRLKLRRSLNRYDKFKNNFYQKVQNGYIKLANKNKKKYHIINSNLNAKDNKIKIIQIIDKIIC